MTPYTIFVIVLTFAYIIYYGYQISKDMYGRKEENNSSEEEFDISSMEGEVVATPVRDMEDGFSLGDTQVVSATAEPESAPVILDKYAELDKDFEEADIQSEGGMMEPEFSDWILQNIKNPTDIFRKSTITESREIY